MNEKAGWIWIMLGALSAGIAVVVGALGAHVTVAGDDSEAVRANWIAIGQRYQLIHALGLVFIGGLILYLPGRLANFSAWGLWIGTLCFSGGLYLQAFASVSAGPIVPLGGGLFILGWLMLALHAGKAAASASART